VTSAIRKDTAPLEDPNLRSPFTLTFTCVQNCEEGTPQVSSSFSNPVIHVGNASYKCIDVCWQVPPTLLHSPCVLSGLLYFVVMNDL
jgi:hypothetical protein